MAEVKITIENIEEIKMAFGKAPQMMTKNLNKAISNTLFNIQRGEFDQYHVLGIHIITGGLYSSIQRGVYQSDLRGEVGPNVIGSPGVDYAGYVHGGTTRMKARPFLYNSVQNKDGDTQKFFKNAVQDTLDEIAREV